jgi:hypothetical protein
MTRVAPDPAVTVATRRCLHGVAELVLAGPQYRTSGTIRLRVVPGGFGTIKEPELRVDGDQLMAGAQRVGLTGTTYAALGAAVGVEVGAPEGLYHDGSGVSPDEPVEVDATAAAYLASSLAFGDEALRRFAPDAGPVLWPEHFDLGISMDEVNYGVSPGDSYLGEPYAYVGPFVRRAGEFWNAPFGAARPLREFADVDALAGFFAEGRDRALSRH